jgi:hypothetical protein
MHTQVGAEFISTEECLVFVETHLKKAFDAPRVHDDQQDVIDVTDISDVSKVSAWMYVCMYVCAR